MKKDSRAASLALTIALALLALTFSIAVPILCRPFYYAHISALDLPGRTGWSAETIRAAYDEVLDFCVLGTPFGTGELAWSASGMSHFADVRVLFRLDFLLLGLSLGACALLWGLIRRWKFTFHRFLGRGPGFWAGTGAAAVVLILAGLAALDFDRAFTVFHAVFFPGKDNWMFNPYTDEIITVMPEQFFMNCAVFIGAGLIFFSAAAITADCLLQKKLSEKNIRARYR